MGTDIHSIAQIKKDGKWITKLAQVANDSRDYDSFAVLADIRNDDWEVLYDYRGLPEDLELYDEEGNVADLENGNYFCVKLAEPYYCYYDSKKEHPQSYSSLGEHTFSHLYLPELEEIQKHYAEKEHVENGMISEKQAKELESGKLPENWCTLTTQPGYVKASWKRPASECLWYLEEVIKELQKLAKETETQKEDVRFVFGFDS